MPATVTFYRGHHRTLCCLPGIISLIIMCVGIIFTYLLLRRRTRLTRLWLELNLDPTAHCVRHALLHTAPKWSSHWTTQAGHLALKQLVEFLPLSAFVSLCFLTESLHVRSELLQWDLWNRFLAGPTTLPSTNKQHPSTQRVALKVTFF